MLPETKILKLKFNYVYIMQQICMLEQQIPLKMVGQIPVKISHSKPITCIIWFKKNLSQLHF